MKSKLIYPMVLVLFAAACGGKSGARGAAQQQYETVQEGSAAGVTSTIQGPGETLPPITGTNADTTTAFALNPNAVPMPQTQAGMAPPPVPSYPMPASNPPMTSSSSRRTQPARPTEVQPAEPQPTEPTAENTPETDTASQTTTTPAPAEEKPPAEDNAEQAEEPPPPPPPR